MRYKIRKYKRRIRIIPRIKSKDLGMIFLFCILLPYVAVALSGGSEKAENLSEQGEILITYESGSGIEKIPLETFLLGALAASIPAEFEEECLKAQAVVLRTNVLYAYQASHLNNDSKELELSWEETGQEYWNRYQMKEKWGDKFDENYKKLENVMQQVKGIRLGYQGNLITAPYFYASAGRTRNGNEVLGSKDYPYLVSVEVKDDLLEAAHFSEIILSKDFFYQKMETLFETKLDRETFLDNLVIKKDEAGYVLYLSFQEKKITGEMLRASLSLPSSCFTWTENNNEIIFTTKGIGHGVGMSQYGAQCLALSNKAYPDILTYYFSGIEIVKE